MEDICCPGHISPIFDVPSAERWNIAKAFQCDNRQAVLVLRLHEPPIVLQRLVKEVFLKIERSQQLAASTAFEMISGRVLRNAGYSC